MSHDQRDIDAVERVTVEREGEDYYGWFWEDDEEFRLPHANHIVINNDDGDEICIIVVRHEALTDKAIADAEMDASRICRALHLADVAQSLF